jgi:hypothetical protein
MTTAAVRLRHALSTSGFTVHAHAKDSGFCCPCPQTLSLPISPAAHIVLIHVAASPHQL